MAEGYPVSSPIDFVESPGTFINFNSDGPFTGAKNQVSNFVTTTPGDLLYRNPMGTSNTIERLPPGTSDQILQMTGTPIAETATITTVADVAGSLNNTYFLLNSPTEAYYFWFNVSGGGTDPGTSCPLPSDLTIDGRLKIGNVVAISTGDSANVVASALNLIIAALSDFGTVLAVPTITVTNSSVGEADDIADGSVATGFTLSVIVPGVTMAPEWRDSSSPNVAQGRTTVFQEQVVAIPNHLHQIKFSQRSPVASTDFNTPPQTGYADMMFQSDQLADARSSVEGGLLKINYPDRIPDLITFARIVASDFLYVPGVSVEYRYSFIFPENGLPNGNAGRDEVMIGMGNCVTSTTLLPQDGFFFGYSGSTDGFTGAEFGIFHFNDSVRTFIAQSTWNRDTLLAGTFILDPSKINLGLIEYGYLGGSSIKFCILCPDGSGWILVHVIEFPNSSIATNVKQPSFGFLEQLTITTPVAQAPAVDTDSCCGCSCYTGVLYGVFFTQNYHSHSNSVSIVATTETTVFNLRNNPTFLGRNNKSIVIPVLFTVASEGAKAVVIKMYFNSVLNAPVWTDIDTNFTCMSFDNTAAIVTPGNLAFTFFLGGTSTSVIDFAILDIHFLHDFIITITAESENMNDVSSSLTFKDIN